ncbi:MAG: M20 metallopeptidase family protein [bacterium]
MSKSLKERLVEIRRTIHQNPELSLEEKNTANLVAAILTDLGLEVQSEVVKTGVVGLLRGRNNGKTIALRADMDALPVQEARDVPYKSRVDGVMHACGHDGHVAMLLGAAMLLSQERDHLSGNVKFIFQPAEESSAGALPMIKEGVLDNPKVDAIVGAHLWPELEAGDVGIQYGPTMGAVDNFWITIKGKGGHGAMPHEGVDAIVVAAHVICALQQIVSRQINAADPTVVSIGTINGGFRRNVVAEEVKLTGTFRTLNPEVRRAMPEKIERIIKGVTESFGATYEIFFDPRQPVTVNERNLTAFCTEVLKDIIGSEHVVHLEKAPLVGEDFAYYGENVPAAFLKIGCSNPEKGITAMLHSAYFDMDEDALLIGAKSMAAIATKYLAENE